mmetsp:Transcript_580/g.978  ORF Transcript_580/g.978 Transcript_580/m.978 type:complete len:276 (+) Transcript_580:881-1708(+)
MSISRATPPLASFATSGDGALFALDSDFSSSESQPEGWASATLAGPSGTAVFFWSSLLDPLGLAGSSSLSHPEGCCPSSPPSPDASLAGTGIAAGCGFGFEDFASSSLSQPDGSSLSCSLCPAALSKFSGAGGKGASEAVRADSLPVSEAAPLPGAGAPSLGSCLPPPIGFNAPRGGRAFGPSFFAESSVSSGCGFFSSFCFFSFLSFFSFFSFFSFLSLSFFLSPNIFVLRALMTSQPRPVSANSRQANKTIFILGLLACSQPQPLAQHSLIFS